MDNLYDKYKDVNDFVDYVEKNAEKIFVFDEKECELKNSSYRKKLCIIKNGEKIYPKNRLSYEVVWDKNRKKHTVFVLFNPSYANNKKLDPTLRNCVKICHALKDEECGAMYIYNTFTIRHSNKDEAIKKIEMEYEKAKNPFFKLAKNFPKNISKLIVAWGNDAQDILEEEYFNEIKAVLKEIIKKGHDVYAYRKTVRQNPMHPGPYCSKYVNEFCKNPKLENINDLF